MIGSEMNENSGEVKGFLQLGYNGEGYLEFDLKTMTWIPLKPEFNIVKQTMDGDRNLINYLGNLFSTIFLERLKMFLDYGSSSLNKTGRRYVESQSFPCYKSESLFTWPNHSDNSHDTKGLPTMCK